MSESEYALETRSSTAAAAAAHGSVISLQSSDTAQTVHCLSV